MSFRLEESLGIAMDLAFCAAVLAYILILFLPGAALLRALGFGRSWSLCLAPVLSFGIICILGQLFTSVGIRCNPLLIIGAPTLCFLALYLFVGRKAVPLELPHLPWWSIALTAVIGLALGYNLYVQRLVTTDQVIQAYDLTQALNLIRSFANSGHFSSLDVNLYLEGADSAVNPWPGGIFYPATWHASCALAVQLTGTMAPKVITASVLVCAALVYPLAMLATIALIFDGSTRHLVAASLAILGFVNFPWIFVVFGPIYPNLAGFCAMPAAYVIFMLMISDDLTGRQRASLVLVFLLACAGLVLMHPNSIFSSIVFLASYATMRVWQETGKRYEGKRTYQLAAAAGFVAFCCAAWYVCFKLPLFHDTVWEDWGKIASTWQMVINILTLAYTFGRWYEFAAQFALMVPVIVGIVTALHDKRYRWIVVSYAIACYILIVSATQPSENDFKHLIGGFWYGDHLRIAGMCAQVAVPLAVIGLVWCYEQIVRFVKSYNQDRITHPIKIAIVCSLVFLVANYAPNFYLPGRYYHLVLNEDRNFDNDPEVFETYSEAEKRAHSRVYQSFHTPFGDFRHGITGMAISNRPLDYNEKDFIKKVYEITGPDALIINNPMDGSFLAYGYQNLKLYYRNFVSFGFDETKESELIRTELANIATNEDVRAAVDKVGAQYVLIMSTEKSHSSFINLRRDYKYDKHLYHGIYEITSDNPSFELLLEDADNGLALYRIREA